MVVIQKIITINT
ncbi:hypothetical protein FWK35_00004586 [Aphis craccivora]|uniref:Uncharacterized protein n=2 Tax=Aphis craccivora TaxID=307492 RepID=A0A6G0YAB6_APHCR|nr:hypothetical protein FWK35_00028446 [Aphis craccivora]KAF0751925.1 hypothetical protein FWK35_00038879 [Aphis craccivora]KAF0771462.1 hypothetical protein FWK35_00004586 [Aphis craccivora]